MGKESYSTPPNSNPLSSVCGESAFDDTADRLPFKILAVEVIDVHSRKHTFDWKETFFGILELRWHINVIIHQGFELDTGDLWPWNINS